MYLCLYASLTGFVAVYYTVVVYCTGAVCCIARYVETAAENERSGAIHCLSEDWRSFRSAVVEFVPPLHPVGTVEATVPDNFHFHSMGMNSWVG